LLTAAAVSLMGCSSGETPTEAHEPAPTALTMTTLVPTATLTPTPSPSPNPTPSPSPTASPIPIYHPPPYSVAIEAGHGGLYYWGATGYDSDGNRWIEKDVTLAVALRLAEVLTERGYRVIQLRPEDDTLTWFDPVVYRWSMVKETQARVDRANGFRADVLLSVHFNGWVDASQSGTETYCNPDRSFGTESCTLAGFVVSHLVNEIRGAGYDIADRGAKNDAEVHGDARNEHSYLLGTNFNFAPSLMPGTIIETLFLSNPADLAFLRQEDAVDVIATGIADGVDAYFVWLMSG